MRQGCAGKLCGDGINVCLIVIELDCQALGVLNGHAKVSSFGGMCIGWGASSMVGHRVFLTGAPETR